MDRTTEQSQVMDGGLALFGLGLFLFFVANLYVAAMWPMTWPILALSLVSLGLAFSEYGNRRTVVLGMSIVLLGLELVAAIGQAQWWIQVLLVSFAAAYAVLWAEYRFSVFGHVGEAQPHHARGGTLRSTLRNRLRRRP